MGKEGCGSVEAENHERTRVVHDPQGKVSSE